MIRRLMRSYEAPPRSVAHWPAQAAAEGAADLVERHTASQIAPSPVMTASSRTNHPTNGTAYRMTRTVTPTTRVQETDGALPPRTALSTRSPSQVAATSWPE